MFAKLNIRTLTFVVVVLYAVELLDELIFGVYGATAPLIKSELALSYTQIGLLTTVPGLVAIGLEPFIGILGHTRFRRLMVRGGILATVFGLALVSFGMTYGQILIAFVILSTASGAYVNLSQATLMDMNPERTDHTMARWTWLGSIGVAVAPLIVAAVIGIGLGWRVVYLAAAGVAGVYVVLIWRLKFNAHNGADEEHIEPRTILRDLVSALRNKELVRWVLLTELSDLMLDQLLGVTGLYFHDVVGVDFAQAALAVSLFSFAGLAGDTLLIPLLERVSGLRILRLSTVVVTGLYAAFLLFPFVWGKYVLIALVSVGTAGWFAILRGRTYAAVPGQSGLVVAITAFANLSVLVTPTILGSVADTLGLQTAMWLLILGPLALLIGLPRSEAANGASQAQNAA